MSTGTIKNSGRSGRKPPQYVTFTQQLKPEFWPGWDVALILSSDVEKIGTEILRRYESAGGSAQGLWVILHDKDTENGCPKEPHVHVVLQQSPGRQVKGKLHCIQIDQAMGWTKSVVKAPSRGGRLENALAYLIHAKDPDKHQYAPDEVKTVRGRDYRSIEQQYRDAWARRAAMGRRTATPKKEWDELGDVLVQRVLDGEVDELDILRDKTLMDIYTRNESKVNLALKNWAKREAHFEIQKLRAGLFQKTIIWVQGASDQGKTYLVESIAAELSARLGWRVFRATAKNGSDDYNAEEIYVMNEPSPRVMEWPDLLQLTDPRQGGPISARYRNKPDAAPRVVLIAVAVDPIEFGFFVPGKRSTTDSLDQLLRRVTLIITAKKVGDEPHYSLGQVAEVMPYQRVVEVPGEQKHAEQIELHYAAGTSLQSRLLDVPHDQAVDVVLGEIAQRSSDVELEIPLERTFAGLRSALDAPLVELGVLMPPGPPVVEVEATTQSSDAEAADFAERSYALGSTPSDNSERADFAVERGPSATHQTHS